MTAASALTASEKCRLGTCREPRSLPGDDVMVCLNEDCALWEYGRTAYTWRDGDPVYQGGALR